MNDNLSYYRERNGLALLNHKKKKKRDQRTETTSDALDENFQQQQ